MNWIKKHLPSYHTIKEHKSLRPFRHILNQEALWKFNVENVARGFAIGIFINFIPIPLQMLWAALLSIAFHANLPIAVLLTWINNPFTFIGINFLIYKTGTLILGHAHSNISAIPHLKTDSFQAFWDSLSPWFSTFGKPYLVGLPVISIGVAFLFYGLVKGAGLIMHFVKSKHI